MGKRIDNITKTFADPKIRGIFIVLTILLLLAIGIGYLRYKAAGPAGALPAAKVAPTPSVESIPGAGEASREYVQLQEQQNVQLAEEAARRGTAAVPTVTRVTYLESGVGGGEASGCSSEELKRSRNAGVTAAELRCRGCSLAALRAAGFTSGELGGAGFNAKDLQAAGFNAADLKAGGFSCIEAARGGIAPSDLKQSGCSCAELKDAGFNIQQLRTAAVCSPQDLRVAGFGVGDLAKAGMNPRDLMSAGFTVAELKAAGMSNDALKALGVSDQDLKAAGQQICSVAELQKLRARGVNPKTLRSLGCSLAALKAAGFTAAELRAAGYSAKELKDAGFSAADLRAAGFSAKELKDAGFSAQELKDAGFDAKDLKDAGFSAGELRQSGFEAASLKNAEFDPDALRKAGFAAQDLKSAGFDADQLKNAGFSDGDLTRAGFEVKGSAAVPKAGCSIDDIRQAKVQGISAADLKTRGCAASDLKTAGFTDADIAQAGFPLEQAPEAAAAAQAAAPAGGAKGGGQEVWSQQLDLIRKQQAQELTAQEYQDKIKQIQQTMATQASELFASWIPLPPQQFVASEDKGGAAATGAGGKAQGQGAEGGKQIPGNIIKAGSVLFAVLDTGINSDERSPVLATILSGDLKGARLIGNFQRSGKTVSLTFNLLNVPYLPSSIPVNAVAIDSNTARAALSGKVDNHYMLRYGSVFAASFLSGVGKAVESSANSVQISPPTGETININSSLTATQSALIGLGEAGSKLSDTFTPLVNTPPTVEIKAGSGIGILLMSDLKVPFKPAT